MHKNFVERLIEITNQIALGEYQKAKELFELTRAGEYPPEVQELAEAIGLMLVRVESREFHLKKTIDELERVKAELEASRDRLALENVELRRSVKSHFSPKNIIGKSKAIQDVVEKAVRLSALPVNVLITGETGTGKELIAKVLHYNGPRRDMPFVAINCSAIPESLFESELFGIEKGVATGVSRRVGRIEQANRGTLFLDEIGDMPLSSQVKLLRVLEERKVLRVGGARPISVDVRIVAATSRDLKKEIREGRFREDLYFRIKVVHLHLPPLRERKEDIPLLFNNFLRIYAAKYGREGMRVSPKAMEMLVNYPWPGNVRELENEAERLVALAPYQEIAPEDLSEEIKRGEDLERDDTACGFPIFPCSLEEMEKRLIESVLRHTGYNKSEAARILGISREGLRKKLIRYGMGA